MLASCNSAVFETAVGLMLYDMDMIECLFRKKKIAGEEAVAVFKKEAQESGDKVHLVRREISHVIESEKGVNGSHE